MQIQDDEFELVLFDLDGTLVDTAPDMVAALQEMQAAFGLDPVPYEFGRLHVSKGAIGLLTIGFPEANDDERDELVTDYIDRYARRICDETALFEGMDTLLDALDDAGCPWGIVTNKPERLTNPLLELLGIAGRCACAVSGDTLPVRKPDPAPLLLACDITNSEPHRTLYAGDAERDIEAGRRAGLATIAAGYGYIPLDEDPREWDSDVIAASTEELAQIVLKAVNLGV